MNIKYLIEDTAGASAIEYGLLAALIGVGMIAAVTSTGTAVNNTMTNVESCLAHSTQPCALNDASGSDDSSADGDSGSSGPGSITTGTEGGRRRTR
ncbi:Flp family type IVb pilin [Parasphingorhabdus sp.]|uniref:Flp family type IVb pilin n=1 Tax=Parasphingorhabdus sp. TaxID=2709688 RepID=UPI003A95D891